MTNPQFTLTVSLGVGEEGQKRRQLYETAAGGKPLSQWVREALDKIAAGTNGGPKVSKG